MNPCASAARNIFNARSPPIVILGSFVIGFEPYLASGFLSAQEVEWLPLPRKGTSQIKKNADFGLVHDLRLESFPPQFSNIKHVALVKYHLPTIAHDNSLLISTGCS